MINYITLLLKNIHSISKMKDDKLYHFTIEGSYCDNLNNNKNSP